MVDAESQILFQFQFQLWSDLHLEICDLRLPTPYIAKAPYLLLAGDIGVPGSARYCTLLSKIAPAHHLVFVVTGNHEYYGSSLPAVDRAMQAMCLAAGPNVVFLNNSSYDVTPTCRIVGTTLWSQITCDQEVDVTCFIADHRLIQGWGVSSNNAKHSIDVSFLRSEVSRATADGVRLIVITHHAPLTHGTSQPRHAGSILSSAFQTGLSALMGPPVVTWCFGHTHHCSSQMVHGTQVLANQRGYVCVSVCSEREDGDFEPDRVFTA